MALEKGCTNVSSLALSGDELAVCADGALHVFVPSQGVTRIVKGSDGLPISSQAVNVAWFGKDILFCQEDSVKLSESGAVAVIAGHSKGDSDDSQSHSKLCQPIGICVEFDRNIYEYAQIFGSSVEEGVNNKKSDTIVCKLLHTSQLILPC